LKKVVIIGWDCAAPELIFDKMLPVMPNLKKLLERSLYGILRTVEPPITVPAWMCMMTGCDPGQLGLYGFRHREPGNYERIWIPDSSKIAKPALWNIVNENQGKIAIVGIPPMYPPPELDGIVVSGFIAPDTDHTYTHPAGFAHTISKVVGDYQLDVEFRTEKKKELLNGLFDMTKKRHQLTMHILEKEHWDLFVMMEIGLDRLHHAFWKYFDSTHHLHEEGNEYQSVFEDYYGLLDAQLGEILGKVPKEALFLLVSDHGAKGMTGAFCINQWLKDKGLLVLKDEPTSPTPFKDLTVDWAKTKAWAWGGYYARIFINVEGYEQSGSVPPEEYEDFRNELSKILCEMRGPNGEEWRTIVRRPEDVYVECNGNYPDLMVYFDDLNWRAAGSVGHPSAYLMENDTGPDDAVHDWDGVYVASFPDKQCSIYEPRSILDIAPTVLRFLGIGIPSHMTGTGIEFYKEGQGFL
jgi:predicted AlkP superfamily phosphohydrolase/phosphomutase